MSRPGGLLAKIGHYSLSKVAMMVAGLISYPILTRVLSPGEYGIMGFVLTLLNLSIGVSKLGLQFSMLRFWTRLEQEQDGVQRLILSFFITTLLISLTVTLLYDGATALIGPLLNAELAFFILVSSPLIMTRAMLSFGMTVLNSSQRSKPFALFEIAAAYASMLLAVLGAAVVFRNLIGYYAGLIAGESLVVLALLIYVLRGTRFARRNIDLGLVREGISFGLPMSVFELSGVLFFTGDRLLILWLADKARLGYYTVAFNLSNYVNQLFTLPVMMTVRPAMTELYETEGSEATSAFLRTAARWFFLFTLAAVAGVTMIREDLLVLLASKKFLPAAEIVPMLVAGMLIMASREILGSGMFLKRRPWLMAQLNVVGALFNAGLNVALIPRLGIAGAALATLISQLVMTGAFWWQGRRLVPVPVDLPALLLHTLCAAAMGGALYLIDPGPGALRLVLRLVAGVVVFSGLLLAVDREARMVAGKVLNRLRGQ
jgi:O-antigen/teichoic acid export membrane protein